MVALAIAWGFSASRSETVPTDLIGTQAAQPAPIKLTPEEHLEQYLRAPYVLNEMPPVLLNTDDLPDGRIAVSFLRRIVEVRYVDSPEDVPVGENNEMSGVPTKLSKEPPPALSSRD